MGDRYIFTVKCPKCGHEEEAWYAPICGATKHNCQCGHRIDLKKLADISCEDASNRSEMEELVKKEEGTMLSKWAEAYDDRKVIGEFWEWIEKAYGTLKVDMLSIDLEVALDEYCGIDRGQLERERCEERRELLERERG